MATQKAVIIQPNKTAAVVNDRPIPQLRPGYVLVDVKAVALNPADWKHIDLGMGDPNCLIGADYAGVVVEVGPGCEKAWKAGDRICGFVHGGNNLQPEDGAFAEKIVAKGDIQIRIPDSMSFAEAATVGVAVITCGQGLYQGLKFDLPNRPAAHGESVLIYGGSSAMGTMGIQFAKLSGYRVLTTSSPRNFDMLKTLGADAVFDYNDPDCALQIRKAAQDNLRLVWDCISSDETAKLCTEAMASGGIYATLLQVQPDRKDIEVIWTLGYTCIGDPINKFVLRADDTSADFSFMKKFIAIAEPLLAEGKLQPHPQRVEHGLDHVLEGVDLLRKNKVSGRKLVYTV